MATATTPQPTTQATPAPYKPQRFDIAILDGSEVFVIGTNHVGPGYPPKEVAIVQWRAWPSKPFRVDPSHLTFKERYILSDEEAKAQEALAAVWNPPFRYNGD